MKIDLNKLQSEIEHYKKNRKIFTILAIIFASIFGACFIAALIYYYFNKGIIDGSEAFTNEYIIYMVLMGIGEFFGNAAIAMFILRFFLGTYKIRQREMAIRFFSMKMNQGQDSPLNNEFSENVNFVDVGSKEVKVDHNKELLEEYRKLKDQGLISEEDFKKKEEELTNNK